MTIPESVRNLPDMLKETYDLVAQVPRGMVTTYGEVAKALGDIVASRYVGLAMSMNDDIVRVPCRRVIQSDGSIGGYTGGGPKKKIRLLRDEGINIQGMKVVDFEDILFKDFESDHPLRDLRDRQRKMKRKLVTSHSRQEFERVAGVDVAYIDDRAFAAMVVFDLETGVEIGRHVVRGDATFPYIPTYLAFREIPTVAPLMEMIDDRTVVMYDGNGILHPEGFGIASHVGVSFDIPTIGVAKRLLCGEVSHVRREGFQKVELKGKVMGFALSAKDSGNPVYVSIGHKLSFPQVKAITAKFSQYRVPEPTRQAHLAAEAARQGTNNK